MIKPVSFFISANILDVITTYYALAHKGIEGNPIAQWTMRFGLSYALAYKVITCSIVVFSMLYLARKGRGKVANVTLYTVGFLVILVSLNNYRIGIS